MKPINTSEDFVVSMSISVNKAPISFHWEDESVSGLLGGSAHENKNISLL